MRRFFALLLTLTLLLGSLTPLAFAEEETTKIPEGFVGEAPSNDPGASTAASEGASDTTCVGRRPGRVRRALGGGGRRARVV